MKARRSVARITSKATLNSNSHIAKRRKPNAGERPPGGGARVASPTASRGAPTPRFERRLRAFTLIELLVSATVMSMLLVAVYLCLHAGLIGQETVQDRTEVVQKARAAMALISADLRSACPLPGGSEFLGMNRALDGVEADNLDFATHHFTPSRPHEGDFCEVSYFLDKNRAGGFSLWRRRDPTPDAEPFSGGSREEIVDGLQGVRFEYTDGYYWHDEWGDVDGAAAAGSAALQSDNLYGMPEAVRVTLRFHSDSKPRRAPSENEKPPPPLVFQTVVFLNLTARSWLESSGGDSGDEGAGDSSATAPETPNPARN